MRQFFYFDIKHAIQKHDEIIRISGGKEGILDIRLLESVLGFIKNNTYYPTFSKKLSHLVYSVSMNHAFQDGNKRTSIALGAYFLGINGYENISGKFIIEMENIVLWVVNKKISKIMLTKIVKSIIINGEITENLKIKILKLLEKNN